METTVHVAAVITAAHKITTHTTPTNTHSTITTVAVAVAVAIVAVAVAITPAGVITPAVATVHAAQIAAAVTATTDLYINGGGNHLLPLLFA